MKIIKCMLFVLLQFPFIAVFSQQGVAINTTGINADPSAMLDISSSDKGLLVPRMTTAERNLINSPAEGLILFNVSTLCYEFYAGGAWQNFACSCPSVSAPSAGTSSATENQIIWNWNIVAGATGYKCNTVNNYSTAIDNGASSSYTQSGLACNTSYSLYVWAYSSCGYSSETTLTQNTAACFVCGISSVTFAYNGSGAPSVTYGTVVGQNGTCWMDRHLGAYQVATAYNDDNGYGDLFQWGRLDDGHQIKISVTTSSKSIGDVPGHTNFIVSASDWRNSRNDNLWQGIAGINNPCPAGWRLPVSSEWNNERLGWSANNYTGAIASALKLPLTGFRYWDTGALSYVASYSGCWSSTVDGVNAYHLYFYTSDAFITSNPRAMGLSVRCIKD